MDGGFLYLSAGLTVSAKGSREGLAEGIRCAGNRAPYGSPSFLPLLGSHCGRLSSPWKKPPVYV